MGIPRFPSEITLLELRRYLESLNAQLATSTRGELAEPDLPVSQQSKCHTIELRFRRDYARIPFSRLGDFFQECLKANSLLHTLMLKVEEEWLLTSPFAVVLVYIVARQDEHELI